MPSNKTQYVTIYGVDCRDVKILESDNYGVWISYHVKHGRKVQKCWIDFAMLFNSPVLADLYREYIKPCTCRNCQALTV